MSHPLATLACDRSGRRAIASAIRGFGVAETVIVDAIGLAIALAIGLALDGRAVEG
ncbi:MAG: hypothetical protein GYA57_21940 [Myxococcales bacterium]|nr:hypothetical protein [Myxococcales bacterium]